MTKEMMTAVGVSLRVRVGGCVYDTVIQEMVGLWSNMYKRSYICHVYVFVTMTRDGWDCESAESDEGK